MAKQASNHVYGLTIAFSISPLCGTCLAVINIVSTKKRISTERKRRMTRPSNLLLWRDTVLFCNPHFISSSIVNVEKHSVKNLVSVVVLYFVYRYYKRGMYECPDQGLKRLVHTIGVGTVPTGFVPLRTMPIQLLYSQI